MEEKVQHWQTSRRYLSTVTPVVLFQRSEGGSPYTNRRPSSSRSITQPRVSRSVVDLMANPIRTTWTVAT